MRPDPIPLPMGRFPSIESLFNFKRWIQINQGTRQWKPVADFSIQAYLLSIFIYEWTQAKFFYTIYLTSCNDLNK